MATTEHRPTERVLDILELLSNSEEGMTLTELAKALNAPKSSIMPLVHTMTARNFIYMQKDTLRYRIGVATYSVGVAYNNRKTSLQFIQQEMNNITALSNETCQLGIQSRNMVLYIAKKDSPQPIRLMSSVGKQLPLYCTGLGRALLAYKSEEEIRSLFPEVLTAYTPHTIATINDLLKELELTRQRGYAVEHEETNLMVNCIAVSLDYNNAPIAALSISIPTFRISESKEKEDVQILWEAKQRIETHFKMYGVDFGNLKIPDRKPSSFLSGISLCAFSFPCKIFFYKFYHNS